MTGSGVFLRNTGDIVGYGKYVFVTETGMPSEVIHGSLLRQFEKKDEHLVSVYGVRIFAEFEDRAYPYRFKSFEDLPVVLGDMNRTEKAFKQVIAWDRNKIVEGVSHTFPSLGAMPRTVSVKSVNSIREGWLPSPAKVRFEDTVKIFDIGGPSIKPDFEKLKCCEKRSPRAVSRQMGNRDVVKREIWKGTEEVIDLCSDSDEEEQACSSERLEESVDQFEFMDEVYAARKKAPVAESFKGSIDQNMDELEAGDAERSVRKGTAVDHFMKELDVDEKDFNFTPRNMRRSMPWKQLSPAERVIMRAKIKKSRRRTSKDVTAFKDILQTVKPISDTQRIPQPSPQYPSCNSHLAGQASLQGQAGNWDFDDSLSTGKLRGNNGKDHGLEGTTQVTFTGAFDRNIAYLKDSSNEPVSPDLQVETRPPQYVPDVCGGMAKRRYRFNMRTRATKNPSNDRSLRRMEKAQISHVHNPFKSAKPCCNDGCFSSVNPEYAVVQYRRFLSMDRVERKRALKSMYDMQGKQFWFDGTPVCSRFLVTLSFSNQLQSAVKGTPRPERVHLF